MPGRRRTVTVALAIVLAAALAGCDGEGGFHPRSPIARSTTAQRLAGGPGPAVDLLPVAWHVHRAAGAERDTYLLFTEHQVEVLEPKGFVLLDWATQGDAMIADVEGWSERLGTRRPPKVPWLTAAAFFRRSGPGWILLDAHGKRLASLRNDGPAPHSSTTITTPEPVTASVRKQTADAVGGPGTRTVPFTSIRGRWQVAGLDPDHAALTISPDGSWTVRGGCASGTGQDLGGAGSLRLLPGGFVLLTEGGVAGVGCDAPATKPPADTAALVRFVEARSLTLQDDTLTLFDRAGKRIGALTRIT